MFSSFTRIEQNKKIKKMLLNPRILLKKYLKYLLRRNDAVRVFLIEPIFQVKKYKNFASVINLVQAIKTLIYYLSRNRFFSVNAYSSDKKILVITENGGFFACCAFRRIAIVQFFNKYKKLPERIDSTRQFIESKPNNKKNVDITHEFFKRSNINIQYTHPVNFSVFPCTTHFNLHFNPHHQIPSYEDMKPFMEKYFQPSAKVIRIIKNIEKKYQLNNYDNLCALYYRGMDKATETNLPTYEEVLEKAKTLKAKYPEIKFLLQSDESDFLEAGLKYFPDATFFKDENIPRMPEPYRNFEHALNLLAIVIILSKCKYIICTTSNVSKWIIYYRGNRKNMMYYRSPKKHNVNYNKNKSLWSCELD